MSRFHENSCVQNMWERDKTLFLVILHNIHTVHVLYTQTQTDCSLTHIHPIFLFLVILFSKAETVIGLIFFYISRNVQKLISYMHKPISDWWGWGNLCHLTTKRNMRMLPFYTQWWTRSRFTSVVPRESFSLVLCWLNTCFAHVSHVNRLIFWYNLRKCIFPVIEKSRASPGLLWHGQLSKREEWLLIAI